MKPPIVVINPNSSEKISTQIRQAVGAQDVEVVTSGGGPPAIESDADVRAAIAPLLAVAERTAAAAYVVACFSDPGLDQLRQRSEAPAFGIAESAVSTAAELGSRIGVISSVAASLPRHERYWAKIGASDLVVADIPLGLGVLQLDTPAAFDRAVAVGHELVESGADVVVLGCTGMTHMEAALQDELGIPVVDPCRAAVSRARRRVEETV